MEEDTMALWLCCQNFVSCSSGRCTFCAFYFLPAMIKCVQQDFCACRVWESSGCSSSNLLPAGPTCCISGGHWPLSCSCFYCLVSELQIFQRMPSIFCIWTSQRRKNILLRNAYFPSIINVTFHSLSLRVVTVENKQAILPLFCYS